MKNDLLSAENTVSSAQPKNINKSFICCRRRIYFSAALIFLLIIASTVVFFYLRHRSYIQNAANADSGETKEDVNFQFIEMPPPPPPPKIAEPETYFADPIDEVTEPPAAETSAPDTAAPESQIYESEPPVDQVISEPIYSYEVIFPDGGTEESGPFADAAFIGDSRTVGLANKSGIRAVFLAEVGMDVNKALSPHFMKKNGEWKSAAELLSEGGYKRVYISLGLNELGWAYSDKFLDRYTELVFVVRNTLPDAGIYVQGIIPMSQKAASEKYKSWGGNSKICEYNNLLRTMCENNGFVYVDVYSVFADETGSLPEVYTSDGIHLSTDGYYKWKDYLISLG